MASVMMAVATWMVASTSTGPITLGSTWRAMMRSGETPVTRAACTYSLLRSTSVEPRTVRAYCTQPVSEIDEDQHAEGHGVVRVGKQRAADAGDQQRHQDRREGQHHVAHAHQEGVDPAAAEARQQARARRRSASTAAPTPRPRPARCARRTSAPTGCRGPGRRCPAGTCALPSASQAGGRRASRQLQRGQVERVVRRDPAARTPRRTGRRSAIAAASIATGEVRKL